MDFETYGEIDVQRIFDNKSLGFYYAFLKKYEKDYKIRLNELEKSLLNLLYNEDDKISIETQTSTTIPQDHIPILLKMNIQM